MAEAIHLPLIVLRVKQLAAHLSISKSAIYERINPHSRYYDASFPKPIKLGSATCFCQHEVNAYLESKMRARRSEDALT
jgi:prophage regulatory protein